MVIDVIDVEFGGGEEQVLYLPFSALNVSQGTRLRGSQS